MVVLSILHKSRPDGIPNHGTLYQILAGDRRFAEVRNEPITAARLVAEEVCMVDLTEFTQERTGYRNDLATWVREDVLSTGYVCCPTLLLHDPEDPAWSRFPTPNMPLR